MPTFSYQAFNSEGHHVAGSVEADSLTLAVGRIRHLGFFPTSVEGDSESVGGRRRPESGRPKRSHVTRFIRELANLINAGLPLPLSLAILCEREKSGGLKNILSALLADIRSGTSLSDSLAQHPRVFNKLYVSVIRAAEAGGALGVALNRLADFAEESDTLADKEKKATRRAVSAVGLGCLLITYFFGVGPFAFAELWWVLGSHFESPVARLLNSVREASPTSYLIMLACIIAVILGARFAWKAGPLRAIVDRIILTLPVIGHLTRNIGVKQFARALAALNSTGMPILESVGIAREAISNRAMRRAAEEAHDSVSAGATIAEPFERSGVLPPVALNILAVGERTGDLDSTLLRVAEASNAEPESAARHILRRIFFGVVIVVVIWALFQRVSGGSGICLPGGT